MILLSRFSLLSVLVSLSAFWRKLCIHGTVCWYWDLKNNFLYKQTELK